MRIIDKYKDYYDYYAGIYGIDPKIIYDRRGSIKINVNENKSDFYESQLYGNDRRLKNENNTINVDALMIILSHKKFVKDDYCIRWHNYYDKNTPIDFYWALQVGYTRYIFKVERFLNSKGNVIIKPSLIKKENDVRNEYSKAPIYLYMMYYCEWTNELKELPLSPETYKLKGITNPKPDILENPILKDTYVSGFISADEMWNNIYNYLINVNDKPVVDTRTNDMHIESNGFDKKTSFRNVK